MKIDNINSNIKILSPFVYLANPRQYLPMMKAVEGSPDLFKRINEITGAIMKNDISEQEYKKSIDELNNFHSLFFNNELPLRNSPDFISVINNISDQNALFHHFCKEVSSSLKFNILSRNEAGDKIRKEIILILEKYSDLIKPKAVYKMFTGIATDSGVLMKEVNEEFTGKCLHRFFKSKDSESEGLDLTELYPMFLYVVTIGPQLDEEVKRLSAHGGDIYHAFVLNGIGAGAADVVAYDLQKYISKEYLKSSNERVLHRMSPGYKDWHLVDQEIIFKILKPEISIGVTLTSSNLMIPIKSTSGVMGAIVKREI
ncbi:MAG: hypothetical protein ISS81_07265 [Candidatus Marinimicrobia bacterium]|nr:hypothetical protein [Candidatus Neomarinimicrobiota bacterium]